MTHINETVMAILQPGLFARPYDSTSDYGPLLRSLGRIVIQIEDDDYQGDSWLLFRHDTKRDTFGYLRFGWGSCSGCDALQRCESYADMAKLRNELHDAVRWGTRNELAEYLKTIDTSVSYSENEVLFVKTAVTYLENLPNE